MSKDLFGHDKVEEAIERLRVFEPPEGYFGAFSGGKDSCVIKELAGMVGVKVDWHYNVTTIDPPELIYFIRKHHSDVVWDRPEKPFLVLHVWTRIQKLGRNFGIGSSLISQRPQEVNKKVLNLTEVLFVFQLTGPQERKAVAWWIEEKGIDEDIASELPKLKPGCPHIWSPAWLQISKIIQISRKETYDASSTPKVGARAEVKNLAPIDLENLRKDMASTIERAKQEDPRELRKQLAEMTKLYHQALGSSTKKIEIPIEVPVLKDEQITRLEKIVEKLSSISTHLAEPIDEMAKHGIAITDAIKKYSLRQEFPVKHSVQIDKKANLPVRPKSNPITDKRIIKEEGDETPRTLRLGERRMLDVLCRWYPARLTKAQLATLSRLRVTSGTFSNYYGTLKRTNLIDEGSNGIQVSELGLYVHGGIKSVPQTTEEIVEMWRRALRAGERRLLDILVEIYPEGISRSELAEKTELTANAGTFSNYFGTLRRNGLAEVSGDQVRAGEALFLQK